MNIHTLDDKTYNLDSLPEVINEIHYAVLDNSNPKEVDYFFNPLIFLESFTSTALVLKIGESIIKMPVDWNVLIGEEETGDLEAVPLTSINDRDFKVFSFNSLSSYNAEFVPIEIIDVYSEVKWYVPKLKSGHYLAVPIDDNDTSRVVYFIRDVTRNSQIVDYNQAW